MAKFYLFFKIFFTEIWPLIKRAIDEHEKKKIDEAENESVKTGNQIESESYISDSAGLPAEHDAGVLTLDPEASAEFESGRVGSENSQSTKR